MRAVRLLVASSMTGLLGAGLYRYKKQMDAGELKDSTPEDFSKAVAVAGVMVAALWVCAAGRR